VLRNGTYSRSDVLGHKGESYSIGLLHWDKSNHTNELNFIVKESSEFVYTLHATGGHDPSRWCRLGQWTMV
jgi:hypothetical protein